MLGTANQLPFEEGNSEVGIVHSTNVQNLKATIPGVAQFQFQIEDLFKDLEVETLEKIPRVIESILNNPLIKDQREHHQKVLNNN